MVICLLLGYLAASMSAFFICYVACVAAAAADQLQTHRQGRSVDTLVAPAFRERAKGVLADETVVGPFPECC